MSPGPRLLGNLYLGTWEPWQPLLGKLGNLAGNLEGTLREPFGNLEEPYLGTFTWEPGNLDLGTWEPWLGNLGTFTWEPLLGTWEPWGNGFWSCSGLLRNLYYGWRPQSILLLGNNTKSSHSICRPSMDCCLLPWGAMMISSPSKRLRPSICLVRQRRVTHEFANEAICLVMEGPLFFHLKTPPPLWQSVSAVTNMLLQWENNTNIKKIDAKDALRRVGLKLEGQSFGMCDRGIYRVCLYIYIYMCI